MTHARYSCNRNKSWEENRATSNLTLGRNFLPRLSQFPIDMKGLFLPKGWEEKKWTHQVIFLREPDGEIREVSIEKLVSVYARWVIGVTCLEIAGIELINEENGRQLFFGLNPESNPEGNMFSGIIYVERGLGGATNVPYVQLPDGGYAVGLLSQNRSLLFQGGLVLQVMGGYCIKVDGDIDAIYTATVASEMDEMGKFKGQHRIKRGDVSVFGRRYNVNKAMNLTGTDDGLAGGISVQGTKLPFELLISNKDGSWNIDRGLVALDGKDRTLEGITKETFYRLDRSLVREVRNPSNGAPSCIHTETAIARAYDYLVLGESDT